MSLTSCRNCRYGHQIMQPTDDGPPIETYECLALPGQVVVVGEARITTFPRRTAKGWCALFKLSVWHLLSRRNG